jgi:hypothetical protein
MRLNRVLTSASVLTLVATSLVVVPAIATVPTGTNFRIQAAGHTSLKPAALTTEIRPDADTISASTQSGRRLGVNKRLSDATTPSSTGGPSVAGSPVVPASNLLASWQGLDHFDTRFGSSAGVNQFSTEPPDQGMCAGNGFVFESINSVVAVYSTSGALVGGPTAINEFYGYPFAFNRTTGAVGPDTFDPSCYYDAATQRWFQVASTLAVDGSGNFTGKSTLDVAVSATADPRGSWTIYHIKTQNDGTDGTPNHGCAGGPCFPDYPHIGADANGFYITINEYPFFANGYNGVDIYSLSKSQLAANDLSINMNLTFIAGAAENAFTVWPAQSPGTGSFATGADGTEYFLSSDAVFSDFASSDHVFLWALTNTVSLGSTPAPQLHKATVPVTTYAVPDPSVQKAGDTPLRDCINDHSLVIKGLGKGCWRLFFAAKAQPAHNQAIQKLDSNDTRMQQVSYADGKIWGALDTAVIGPNRAGIAWYAITPSLSGAGVLSGTAGAQGNVAATGGNNVIYPALAVNASGHGVMAFTLVGPDHFPSAAYVTVSASGTGAIQVARAGGDSQDGFAGYVAFNNPVRPRWGDYGAAAVVGNNVWIASEYIDATCSYGTWLATNFRCGNTRTSLANWSTRISEVAP